MRFVDEIQIRVEGGNGGHGCCGFRREKYIRFGGPDGGDGGDGGSIYLVADPQLTTLIDYHYRRMHRAKRGSNGSGKEKTGAMGESLYLKVPVGTVVYDAETDEVLGDMTTPGQELCVAKGGDHGVGNARFKTSTNRAPRHTVPGKPGEQRELRLVLQLLADVGLLGLPNAGKSTLISAISAARPKIADYPFTTLHPNLGVVRVSFEQSFVVADIPGLIEGAAEGAGLGVRFLKHLARTRLLLHVIDISPMAETDPIEAVKVILHELAAFDPTLAAKPRWLVFNKIDLIPMDERPARYREVLNALNWKGPVFPIAAATGEGTDRLVKEIAGYFQEMDREIAQSEKNSDVKDKYSPNNQT